MQDALCSMPTAACDHMQSHVSTQTDLLTLAYTLLEFHDCRLQTVSSFRWCSNKGFLHVLPFVPINAMNRPDLLSPFDHSSFSLSLHHFLFFLLMPFDE